MPFVPAPLRAPLSERLLVRLRGRWVRARHRALHSDGLWLSSGAEVRTAPTADIRIGPGFVARRDLTLTVQGRLRIGRGMFCNRGVMLAAMREVVIGDGVRLGERVSIIDHNHVIQPLDDLQGRFEAYEAAPITIGHRVLISANCVVLAGARIGDDAVIAAGSVVRGEIPPGVLAAGAPAAVKRVLAPSAGSGAAVQPH